MQNTDFLWLLGMLRNRPRASAKLATCAMKMTGTFSVLAVTFLFGAPLYVNAVSTADVITVGSRTYVYSPGGNGQIGRRLKQEDLGREFAKVTYKIVPGASSEFHYSVGATVLEPGTALHYVRGYGSWFRLAARTDEHVILYECEYNPKAHKGSDILDIERKIAFIGISSDYTSRSVLGAITNATLLTQLAQMVIHAPVRQDPGESDRTGPQYVISFHFHDGTATSRMFWTGSGHIWRGIIVPRPFASAIEREIESYKTRR